MNEILLNDLQNYINFHIKYQMRAYNLATRANQLGFPGFYHFFQVEAADAMVHTRRIMNYISSRGDNYKLYPMDDIKDYSELGVIGLIKELKYIKEKALEITNCNIKNANKEKDFLTAKFYDWFLLDFFEEISYENDILDYINMKDNALYSVDKKLAKAKEPCIEEVIKPFS